jgi:hypothetical protein
MRLNRGSGMIIGYSIKKDTSFDQLKIGRQGREEDE